MIYANQIKRFNNHLTRMLQPHETKIRALDSVFCDNYVSTGKNYEHMYIHRNNVADLRQILLHKII